jgi:CTP-dependent riboflavin kinase
MEQKDRLAQELAKRKAYREERGLIDAQERAEGFHGDIYVYADAGERKLSAQPRLATLHVKVTPADKIALYELAKRKDISVAQLVRTMIRAMTGGGK